MEAISKGVSRMRRVEMKESRKLWAGWKPTPPYFFINSSVAEIMLWAAVMRVGSASG